MYQVVLTKDKYVYGVYDTEQLAKDIRDGLNEMIGKRLYKVVKA